MPIRTLLRAAALAGLTILVATAAGSTHLRPSAPAAAAGSTPRPAAEAVKKRRRAARAAAAVPGAPDDPLWGASWGLRAVGAPAIWRSGTGSPRVVVAVVDSGVDPSQPDLAGALVPGWNALDGSTNTADTFGHGTAVAGVVAARAGNRVGGSGYCPRCSIMPIKVLDGSGRGTGAEIAAGIGWAVDHGADVINLSLTLNERDPAVTAAIANAESHGLLVVAAAGNDGGTTPHYPAAEPGVISVAAFDPSLAPYSWSTAGSWVTVAAPGCNETGNLAGGYGAFCGTSSAAAAVSGLVALALADAGSAAAIHAAVDRGPGTGGVVPRIDGRALVAAVLRRAR